MWNNIYEVPRVEDASTVFQVAAEGTSANMKGGRIY
jgi:hypothetical protein